KDDLRRFSVGADRLVARIAACGNLGGAVASIADGIWLLGDTLSGHAAVLCFDAGDLVVPGAIMAIKAAAGQKPIVLIANDTSAGIAVRLREAGIELHEFADVFKDGPDGGERLVLEASSSRLRLVLKLSAQSVTLDGRRLDLPTQM